MKQVLLLLFIFICIGCKPKIDVVEPNAGEINPSHFVCLGGNEMAGYCNDALYYNGQEQSLGNLLAKQLKLVGGEDFSQPLMPESSVGISHNGLSKLILGYKTDCLNNSSLSPVRLATSGDLSALNTSVYNPSVSFGNWGIPGLKIPDVFSLNYSNPFYTRMQSSAGISILDESIFSNNATFFAIYLGVEDVLAFAKSGATTDSMTPLSGAIGLDFENSLSIILATLSGSGAKGVISTIPDVTQLPYFTTIPINSLDLDSANAHTLNSVYNPIGFDFVVGTNSFMIEDPSANAFGVRPLEDGERILLSTPLDSVKCFKMGSVFPFRSEFILTIDEINEIQTRINQYNAVIKNLAEQYNLAVVDTKEWYHGLNNGMVYNGSPINSSFVSGSVFSLDGITLTGRGNALLCNEFINAINSKYNANIPKVNALEYNAILFP